MELETEFVPFKIIDVAGEPCLRLQDNKGSRLLVNADIILDISNIDGVYHIEVLRDDSHTPLKKIEIQPKEYSLGVL